jgi:phosphohistidine phosphatase
MAEEGLIPERALCSGARRAVETWERVMEAMGERVQTEFQEEIYGASPDVLLRMIRSLPDEEDSVLLVGHNPTFESLALRLAGSGKDEAILAMTSKYPTGALAIMDFPARRWADLEEGEGNLRDFVRPRQLA